MLAFIERVLAQAKDEGVPLLERLRFLCISAANLDEYFEVRVAVLEQQTAYGVVEKTPDGKTPVEQLSRIRERVTKLVAEQYQVLNELITPALRSEGIYFLRRSEWNQSQREFVHTLFQRDLLPMLSPIGLDPAHPFPKVLNKSLNFIVTLEGIDAYGRPASMAIVQAPRSLPRLIQLPDECKVQDVEFVFLSSVIHAHIGELFEGINVTGCYQFRCTRNSDLLINEAQVPDLMRALEGQLPVRGLGDAVRLEVTSESPEKVRDFLRRQFMLDPDQVYICDGPVNLTRLNIPPSEASKPQLRYPVFVPHCPENLAAGCDIFAAIREGDLLLHHPFQSFSPVLNFISQAARDPDVLAIRQTLYRTGIDSAVVEALVDAAHRGKEVTVVIELLARFDEEANVELANLLQEAGAHVVYGIVGYKAHAKMLLVMRREKKRLRNYVHLSTGNYHSDTAIQYTDYGLFTYNNKITEDAHRVFQQITGPAGQARPLKKILQAPFTLHKGLLRLINREIKHAKNNQPAKIIAKMNALHEPEIINALCQASQAGVQIDLIVRGICILRPGVKGLSENIRIRSIVGRFLEHDRVFYFNNNGDKEVYLASADWMERNFFHRIEVCFPVLDEALAARLIGNLNKYLLDRKNSWILRSDGTYKKSSRSGERPFDVQDDLQPRALSSI